MKLFSNLSTGWFGIPGIPPRPSSRKVHAVSCKRPICGANISKAHNLYNVVVPMSLQPFRAKSGHRSKAFLMTINKWKL